VSGNALRFDGKFRRTVTTAPFQGPATVSFSLRFGTGGRGLCEEADDGEGVWLESSVDGSIWTVERQFLVNDITSFTPTSTTARVPGATARLRLRQVSFNAATFDNWAIDDFVVSCAPFGVAASPTFLVTSTAAEPRRSTVTMSFVNCDSVTATQFTLRVTGDTSAFEFVSSTYPAGGCSINGCSNVVTRLNGQAITFQFVVDVRKFGSFNLVFEMVTSGGVVVDSGRAFSWCVFFRTCINSLRYKSSSFFQNRTIKFTYRVDFIQ